MFYAYPYNDHSDAIEGIWIGNDPKIINNCNNGCQCKTQFRTKLIQNGCFALCGIMEVIIQPRRSGLMDAHGTK